MATRLWPVAVAVLMIGFAGAGFAQAPREESSQQNVRESEQYERLLCSNPGFRKQRIQKECGGIDDPQMREQCVASFDCGGGDRPAMRKRSPGG